jgi:hypothetical protein
MLAAKKEALALLAATLFAGVAHASIPRQTSFEKQSDVVSLAQLLERTQARDRELAREARHASQRFRIFDPASIDAIALPETRLPAFDFGEPLSRLDQLDVSPRIASSCAFSLAAGCFGKTICPDPMGYRDGANAYAFAGNDPSNHGDPLGLYQSDFHQGMTAFLARAAGFSETQSQFLGQLAVSPDNDQRGPFFTGFMLEFSRRPLVSKRAFGSESPFSPSQLDQAARDLRDWHFPLSRVVIDGSLHLHVLPNSPEARIEVEAGIVAHDLASFGQGLHALQDSFSHQGEPASSFLSQSEYVRYGHPDARGGQNSTDADLPDKFPEAAIAAAKETFRAMVRFRIQSERLDQRHAEALLDAWYDVVQKVVEFVLLPSPAERRRWLSARGILVPDKSLATELAETMIMLRTAAGRQ